MDWISCELDRLFGKDWERDTPPSGQPTQAGMTLDRSSSAPSSTSAALTHYPRATTDSRRAVSTSGVPAMTSVEFRGHWTPPAGPFVFSPSAPAAVRFGNLETGGSSGVSKHFETGRLQAEAAALSSSPASTSSPSDSHSPAASSVSALWTSPGPSSPSGPGSPSQTGPRPLRGSRGALPVEQGGPSSPRLLPLADTTGSCLLDRRRKRHRSLSGSGAGAGQAGQETAPFRPRPQSCAFCHKNGESRRVVTSHRLRDSAGRIVCPVLRQHVCEVCHGTGDTAHTRTYCPLLTRGGCQRPPASATVQLKSTRLNAAGKRRF